MYRMLSAGFLPVALLLVFFVFTGAAAAFVLQNPLANEWGFRPTDVATGPNESLYVADYWNRVIQVFDLEGQFRFAFSAPGILQMAIGSDGTVFGTGGGRKMSAFSPDGTFLFSRDGGGRIERAHEISIGANDELFLLDADARLVHVLDGQGNWLRTFGQAEGGGSTLGARPTAMATDSEGRLYVADGSRGIGVFDSSGNRLDELFFRDVGAERRFTSALAISGGHLYVGDDHAGVVDRYTLDGTFIDTAYGFPRVDGMGVGPGGEVYLAHEWARSVDRITPHDFPSRQVGVTRFFDRPSYGPYTPEILDRTGIGRTNREAETTAETFIVPGQPGEIVELAFSYFHKSGSQEPRFGVFDRGVVTADPINQPLEFGIQALEARLLEFTKPGLGGSLPDGTPIGTISVAAGTEIGFFMFADRFSTDSAVSLLRAALAQHGAGRAYELLQNREPPTVFPYFSISRVNHGRVDQFVTFLGDGFTVIAAEDTLLRSVGDVDIMDMVIKINVRLIPAPEPAAGALAVVAGALLALVFANRRRRILV